MVAYIEENREEYEVEPSCAELLIRPVHLLRRQEPSRLGGSTPLRHIDTPAAAHSLVAHSDRLNPPSSHRCAGEGLAELGAVPSVGSRGDSYDWEKTGVVQRHLRVR